MEPCLVACDLVGVTIGDVGLFLAGMGVQPTESSASSEKNVKKKTGGIVNAPSSIGLRMR